MTRYRNYNQFRSSRPYTPPTPPVVQTRIEPEHAEALAQMFLDGNPELAALRDQSAAYDQGKFDLWGSSTTIHNKTQTAYDFEFTLDGKLEAQEKESRRATVPAPVNDTALGQVAEKLGPYLYGKGSKKSVPMDMLRAARGHASPDVTGASSRLLNSLIALSGRSPWLVRYATEDNASFVRAVLSATHYAPVENTAMIDTLAAALQLQAQKFGDAIKGIKFVRPYVGISSMHITASILGLNPRDELDPGIDGGDDTPGAAPYAAIIHLSNAEDGTGGLRVSPGIQRHSCTNSIIFDEASTLAVSHVGLSSSLIYNLTQAIGNALVLGVKHTETLMDSRAIELPDIMGTISKLAKAKGWSEETTNLVRTGTEGGNRLYNLVNGITWVAAHSDLAPERRHEFETLGGTALLKPSTVFGKEAWATAFEGAHSVK